MTDEPLLTKPVACVTWWLDACQDRHFEAAPDYVPILKTDLAAKDAEIERLRAALLTVRQAIMEGNPEAIIDTVWVSDIETAVDFIDTALETPA